MLAEVTPEIAERLGYDRPGGAYVIEIVDGGPADLEDLLEGDIITQFENHPVVSAAELNGRIRCEGAGSVVSVHVWRDGGETWLGLIKLAARPDPRIVGDTIAELRAEIEDLSARYEEQRALGEELDRELSVLRIEVRDLRDKVLGLRARGRPRIQRATPSTPTPAPRAPSVTPPDTLRQSAPDTLQQSPPFMPSQPPAPPPPAPAPSEP